MKIKLILGRTEYDPVTAWTAIKSVEVTVPLVVQEGWQVIGADWEYDKEYEKLARQSIEQSRLIQSLEDEIDALKGNNKPKTEGETNEAIRDNRALSERDPEARYQDQRA